MDKKKVLVTRLIPETGIRMLEEAGFELNVWTRQDRPMTRQELTEKAKEHQILLVSGGEQINKKLLDACPDLEMISLYSVGYNNVDIAEATRRGIPVGNTPDVLTASTADIAFGLMLAVSRKMFYLHKTILDGKWDFFRPTANLGMQLKNKTLGIFGLGRIGRAMPKGAVGPSI